MEQEQEQMIDQVMKEEPDVGITAMTAMSMFEVLSKKVAECKELIEQYKKTYPDIMSGGIAIVMAAGLFSTKFDDKMGIMGMMPIELVEGYYGSVRNMVNKLKADVEE